MRASLSGEASFVISETAGLIMLRPSHVLLAQEVFRARGGVGERRCCADIYSSPGLVCGHWTGDKRRTPKVRGQNRVRALAEVPLPGEDKQREQPRCEEFLLSGKSISGHV